MHAASTRELSESRSASSNARDSASGSSSRKSVEPTRSYRCDSRLAQQVHPRALQHVPGLAPCVGQPPRPEATHRLEGVRRGSTRPTGR